MKFPAAVPEIPVSEIDPSVAYYVETLGFAVDWGADEDGIAGISRGSCRLFLTDRPFRETHGNSGPVLVWLNLNSKAEVDARFAEWTTANAKIVSEPEDKAWKLREFTAADLDGNLIRVFYDFRGDESEGPAPTPVFSSIEAQLFVADVRSSCEFYAEKLGFAVEFVYGDPHYYGQVRRDEARLNLRLVCEPVFAGDVRKREQLLAASITVATAGEIESLFMSYQAAGVSFEQELRTEPRGARTLGVSDPDGNLILFAGPSE